MEDGLSVGTEAIEFDGSFAPLTQAYLQLTGGTLTGDLTVNGHIQGGGNIPGLVAGAGAGSGPPSPVLQTGSTDLGGFITWGTGTSPNTQAQLSMTFGKAWVIPGGGNPHVSLTPANSATAALGVMFIAGLSPTGFTINVSTAPAASQGNTTYALCYTVMG